MPSTPPAPPHLPQLTQQRKPKARGPPLGQHIEDMAAKALLREQVAEEKRRADKTRGKAREVLQEAERLIAMSGEMRHVQDQHAAHVSMQERRREERTKPIGGVGMLSFADGRFGSGNHVLPAHEGRSSKRTGFFTDYAGRSYLGESERSVHFKELLKQREAARQADQSLEDHRARSPGEAAKLKAHKNQSVGRGVPDLDWLKKCSSRRTKAYTDYSGRRIGMDPCDWPTSHEFILIGK